jgi:RNA polymerase sigma-70 factor (ECF subfamily)
MTMNMTSLRMTVEVDDRDLITCAQQGDRDAFGEIVRRHHSGVVNVVYRMYGDAQLAEDAAQDAFIRVWQHLPSFKPDSSLRNWIYRIAINAALDVLRREPKTPMLDLETFSMPDSSAGPESVFLEKERALIVQRAILSLSEATRSILTLREYGGLSYQEIAATLNIPLGTVMSRLNYARERLKEILTPQLINMETAND